MKTLPLFSILVALLLPVSLHAQTVVTESPAILTATVLTQGTDNVTRTFLGVTVTIKKIVSKPFTNRDVIAAMVSRGLLDGTAAGWVLVQVSDDTGAALFAKKTGQTHVAVPADLLTPVTFAHALNTGVEVVGPNGSALSGAGQIALGSATVAGVPVSGISTNGTYVVNATVAGKTIAGKGTITTLNFTGGTGDDTSATIVKGVLVIGKGKATGVAGLF